MLARNKYQLRLKSAVELTISYPPPGCIGHGRSSCASHLFQQVIISCIKKTLWKSKEKIRASLCHSLNKHGEEMSCSKKLIIRIDKTNLEWEENVLGCRWYRERNRFAQGRAGSLWQSQELNTTLLKPSLKIVLDNCTWTQENTNYRDNHLLTSILEVLGSISL